MKQPAVRAVADAILYEGYLLYPYRPSSVKNRQRWTFGGLFPRAFSQKQPPGCDPCALQIECLVRGDSATVTVELRFLQLIDRPLSGCAWQEAAECNVTGVLAVNEPPVEVPIEVPGDAQRAALVGNMHLAAERLETGLFRLRVQVRNETPLDAAQSAERQRALLHAFVSTHALLEVERGEFVSLLDPPPAYHDHAAACRNIGVWPVLAGAPGTTDTLLCSPIILYDYPQIAPESPGDLFDATEIDEILTLRILTLTDDEKRQMCAADERARLLLERTEALARDQLAGLHGTQRGLRPVPRPE